MAKLFVEDLRDLKNKRVLIRVDFNVPLDERLQITDDTRIREALPTIRYVLDQGAKVILMSHLGRPKGKPDPKYSLRPVAARLGELIHQRVALASDCVGPAVEAQAASMKSGDLLLLENLRFHKDEEDGVEEFSKNLARLGDIYISDAFGTAHRAHASMVGITRNIPRAASGYLLRKEIKYLEEAVNRPIRPFIAILGGAKVSDKIKVIDHLLDKVDALLIGGAMAYTFLLAKGMKVGNSLVEKDKVDLAKMLLEKAGQKGKDLLIPVDHVVSDKLEEGASTLIVAQDKIPDGWIGVDIGPETVKKYQEKIITAKTILWNGPMGVFELNPFAKGTEAIARALSEVKDAQTIVGGGDSVAALAKLNLTNRMTHVSTGGGASLEYLEGRELPGIAALSEK